MRVEIRINCLRTLADELFASEGGELWPLDVRSSQARVERRKRKVQENHSYILYSGVSPYGLVACQKTPFNVALMMRVHTPSAHTASTSGVSAHKIQPPRIRKQLSGVERQA